MIPGEWEDSPLNRDHDRQSFDCGDGALNAYLQRYARQNHDNGSAKTFVASSVGELNSIIGYYTLSPASLDHSRMAPDLRKGLGRYDVPVFRLGRLAVDLKHQGLGIGGRLLLRAGRRCIAVSEEVGGVALLIDAKNDRSARWYAGYGAVALLDAPQTLVLPLKTIATALR